MIHSGYLSLFPFKMDESSLQLIGIDTGGTFTDFVLFEEGGLRIHKVLSTPQAPEQAILRGIREMGLDPGELRVVHGSTVATNAALEGKGVRTVYIGNRGLGDLLTIGRQARQEVEELKDETDRLAAIGGQIAIGHCGEFVAFEPGLAFARAVQTA